MLNEKNMKNIIRVVSLSVVVGCLTLTGCLKSGMEELTNSSDKVLSSIDYTYRFLYNDTIQKGTDKQQILEGRMCEVLFKKNTVKIEEGGLEGFKTTISYDANSVLKAGPTGSVTKAMLFKEFEKLIKVDQLNKLWVYITISDVATITGVKDAPKLGSPGNFSTDHIYTVRAADGSSKEYLIKTVKGF